MVKKYRTSGLVLSYVNRVLINGVQIHGVQMSSSAPSGTNSTHIRKNLKA